MNAHRDGRICIPAFVSVVFALLGPGASRAQPIPLDVAPAREIAKEASLDFDRVRRAFTPVTGEMELSGRLIVRPLRRAERRERGAIAADVDRRDAQARARLDPHLIRHESAVDHYVVRTPAGVSDLEFAMRLLATRDYAFVEPDWICFPHVAPDDPSYGNQWHHVLMHSEQAWDITQGDPAVICAVVDSGVDASHPDFQGVLVPGYNSLDRIAELDGGDVSPVSAHGTEVAGCIGAIGNNGTAVAGIGWNLRIMPIRAQNEPGGAFHSDLNAGARWAVLNGAKIINISFAGNSSLSREETAAYVRRRGGLLFNSAGNSNTNLSWYDWESMILVSATDSIDDAVGFSSFGRAVDVSAPGLNVLTTSWPSSTSFATGTSFASPVAAGVAAMIWSIRPEFTPAQVETALYAGAVDLGEPGKDAFFGHGRVDLLGALTNPCVTGGGEDCNANGVADVCDIASGAARDCNGNGVPDVCELESGAARDCNANGIPDECDLQGLAEYSVSDSNDPDGPVFNFEDIDSIGEVVLLGDDEVSAPIVLPFEFKFFGAPIGGVRIGSNGFITFRQTDFTGCCTGDAIPSPLEPNALVAGWWEDLDPSSFRGQITWEALGSAPNRRFIIQFTDVPHWPDLVNYVTMQYKLFEGSHHIEIHYLEASGDDSFHSVGIESAAGSVGVEYFYGRESLDTPIAIRFTHDAVDDNRNDMLDSCERCPGDANRDRHVNEADLAIVLTRFGTNDPDADVFPDGVVDNADIAKVLIEWGPCE